MTTPRILAMQRLREKEELERQAAILGANKRKGIMSSLPTNLGSIGQFISDDKNDLDNLSFSTNNGLKVNFQNNRNKESGDPELRLGDIDFSSLGATTYPRALAMQELKRNQELERGMVNRENAIYDNPGTDAINSFIAANSAKSNDSLGRRIGDGMGDNLAEVMAISQQLQKNHGFDNIEPLADKSLYQIPDHPYGDIHDSAILSDYANFEGINLRGDGTLPDLETLTELPQSDFEPYYLPLGDGEEWYVESPEEEKFLLNSTIAERAAYSNMNAEEAAAFLKNRVSGEFEEPLPTGMDALYPELDPELSTQMPLLDPEDRDVFVTDDAEMIKTDLTAYEEAILDGDMDKARDIRLQGHADNYQRYEELKLLYPNQALTSQYYPDVDYSHPNLIAQLKQKNDDNLKGKFDIHNPMGWTIGYADNKENANKYATHGDPGLLEYAGVQLSEDEVEKINKNNEQKLLASTDDSLIEEDMFFNRYGFTRDDMTNLGEEDEVIDYEYDMEPMDDGEFPDLPEVPVDVVNPFEDTGGNVLSDDPEVAKVQIEEEEETLRGIHHDLSKVPEGVEAVKAVKETKKKMESGELSQEGAEEEASNIFSWFGDLFGVDDKSLLRALVKYIGGMLFGLTSGKAAAFAWAGVEQDMAREAARGADARKWQDNMDEFDRMYKTAIDAGDIEGAERIFRKREEYSGKDKTEAEKYFDNVEFLEGKLAQAIADGDKPEMVKAITAQLERYKQGGIDGDTTIEPVYDVTVQDQNGNEKILDARDGPSGREIQLPNGKFVPVKDYVSDDPNFGDIIHISKVNASDAQPVPFQMAGDRYDSESDAEFEEQLDAIDAKFESGGYGEGDEAEIAAYYDRVKVHNANKNRNSNGQLYAKKIPYARNISNTGVVSFPPFKEAEKKSAYQLAEGARGLAKLKLISENPKAMAQVNKWTAQWESIATGNDMDYGAIRSFISRKYRANPLQQAYYMGMLELTTSKLRRDTGAAYNMKEMYDTMTRYTNYKDASTEVTEMKLAGAEVDLEAIAGMTRSGQYWLGVLDGTYRPSDSWQTMMGSIYTMMENEGVYTSVGDGDGDGSSTRNFEIDYPG